MKNFYRILFLLLFISQFKIFPQDLIFFLDSQEQFSYPNSWGFATSPSNLELVFGRFPTSTKYKFTGKNSLKLYWKSAEGGNWGVAAATDGWSPNDFTLKDTISFMLYSASAIDSKSFPFMYLEDVYNNKTLRVSVADYVKKIKIKKWQKVSIPVSLFKENINNVNLKKIKTIFWGQGIADNLEHTLYIDDLKITGGKVITGDSTVVIVVLGSSTAEGFGAAPIDSSWVNRYRSYIKSIDSSYYVINLGIGGYSTYQIMPSNFLSPVERPKPSITKNITYALTFHPSAIIINLPSNDAAYGYSNSEQLKNYDTILNIASKRNIPVWIGTPQPRNFPLIINNEQMELRDSIINRYGDKSLDFWNPFANLDGTQDSIYAFGDGIHLNNLGHRIIFEKVVDADILSHLSRKIAHTKPFAKTKPEKEKFVDSLLLNMTLAEKVGQLVQIVGIDKVDENWIRQGKVGSYLSGVWNPDKAQDLQSIAVKESRLKIPLLFANDIIHGYTTIFPVPLAAACSWDPELVKESCKISAFEAASEGTHWTYAPMVDISRDPRWGRVVEGSGEDPYLGSVMAAARIKGFQGNSLNDEGTIAATAKHFVAYGAVEAGRDYNSVNIGKRILNEIYLPPFKMAVDSGVATLMSAFNDIDGVPASANHYTITDVLRKKWKFKGFAISDFNSIAELIPHGIAADKPEAALKGFSAGVDVDMVGDTILGNIYSPSLEELVKEGKLSEDYINQSVRRVLGLKYDLGLFTNPYINKKYFEEHAISQEEKDKTALQLSRESIVLLKNKNNILPLNKNINSIAVIGSLAEDVDNIQGGWAGKGKKNNLISVLEAIQNKVSANTKINYAKGCDINDLNKDNFEEAIEAAKNSDITIVVVGESSDMSGEAASKTNLDLPGVQEELIKQIHNAGVPIIAVLINGRPLTISWLNENIDGIIEAWYLGDQAGNAVSDVLFGDYNPSGKLTMTFPRSVGQIPIYYDHKNTGRPFVQDDKFTSKYLDSPNTPLYSFGYGLSYTTFKYDSLQIFPITASMGDTLIASVQVSNVGKIEGDEIVEMYIRDEVASVTRPVKELKGFQRINLKPYETKKLYFKITPDMLSFYGLQMKKIIEPGKFDVMIGSSSDSVLTKSFELTSN